MSPVLQADFFYHLRHKENPRILDGMQFLPSRDLPNLGVEPVSAALVGGFFTSEPFYKVSITLIPKPEKDIARKITGL